MRVKHSYKVVFSVSLELHNKKQICTVIIQITNSEKGVTTDQPPCLIFVALTG